MSRKISDFFKVKPIAQNKDQARNNFEIKNEAEQHFEINLDKIQGRKLKIPVSRATSNNKLQRNSSKVIKIEPKSESDQSQTENLQIFKDISAIKEEPNDKYPENIKTEPEKEFAVKLPPKLVPKTKKTSQHKPNISIPCDICGKSIKRFVHHMRIKHLFGIVDKYECDYDGKVFNKRISLNFHMESHLPKVNCNICGVKLKVNSMKEHMKALHSDERKYKCKICLKTFKLHCVLQNHMGSHDKKFECKICSKKFRNAPDLKVHTKEFHENPRSYKCEVCEKGFYDKGNLKKHQKTHDKNRVKAYKCDRCNYSSDNKAHYKSHQKSHERWDAKVGKNPLKCPECSIMLKDKKHLSFHMGYVHPVNLFQCDLCAMYSKTRANFKKHMKIVHLNAHLRSSK